MPVGSLSRLWHFMRQKPVGTKALHFGGALPLPSGGFLSPFWRCKGTIFSAPIQYPQIGISIYLIVADWTIFSLKDGIWTSP